MHNFSKKGFSLIELMIVIAIVALLAMIALPNFMRFLAKAKRTEAYVNLRAIYAAEKSYFAEHGTYSPLLSGQGGVGWKPDGYKGGGAQENFFYTYGFAGSEGKNYFTGKGGGSAGQLSGNAGKDTFVAMAVADIDSDGKPDVISINERGEIVIVQDDLAD